MKHRYFAIIGTVGLAAALLLTACQGKSGANAKSSADTTWSRMEKDVITTMDPSLITDSVSGQAAADTYEGLYRYYGAELEPGVAKSVVKPTQNGTVYTFKLRNSKWSNGDPVTAKDFVFAWKRTVDPATKSQYAYLYTGIKNADQIMAGKKKADTLGVKALDDHTFQVTLEHAIPYFGTMMVSNAFYPENQKVVDQAGKKFGTQSKYLVFNGPYKLTKWNGTGNSWTEVKNPDYWNAKDIHVNKINVQVVKDASTAMNLFQAGKLDDAQLDGDQAAQAKSEKDYKGMKQSRTTYLEFNQKKIPAFRNAKLRQAVSLAIDRQEFVKKVLNDGSISTDTVTSSGLAKDPTTGKDFTKSLTASTAQYTAFNLAKAKKLWQEGLQETGQKSLDITLLSDDTSAAKRSAEYFQNALGELPGLKISVQPVPFKTRIARSMAGNFDMVISGWGADFPDPISFLDLFTTDNTYNFGHYSNKQYDALIAASKTTDATNETKRWADLRQAQELLTKEEGIVPVYQMVQSHLVNPKMQGMTYSPNNLYNFIGAKIK